MSNVVRQIAPKYWLVESGIDAVVGLIVWLGNGTYVVHCDGMPASVFGNQPAAIEYAETPSG